jgi:hypothetical protein
MLINLLGTINTDLSKYEALEKPLNVITLGQARAMSGPLASCGLPRTLMWHANTFYVLSIDFQFAKTCEIPAFLESEALKTDFISI